MTSQFTTKAFIPAKQQMISEKVFTNFRNVLNILLFLIFFILILAWEADPRFLKNWLRKTSFLRMRLKWDFLIRSVGEFFDTIKICFFVQFDLIWPWISSKQKVLNVSAKTVLTSLKISDVDTVWTWGDERPSADK